jgi:hypothetical protein
VRETLEWIGKSRRKRVLMAESIINRPSIPGENSASAVALEEPKILSVKKEFV